MFHQRVIMEKFCANSSNKGYTALPSLLYWVGVTGISDHLHTTNLKAYLSKSAAFS